MSKNVKNKNFRKILENIIYLYMTPGASRTLPEFPNAQNATKLNQVHKFSKVWKSRQKLQKCNKSHQRFESLGRLRWPPAARGQLKMTLKVPKGPENDKSVKSEQKWTTLDRIAAKPRSQQWSKFLNENHQKLTFREGVRPWDLARFSRRIESYRFIMESSKSKPYSANYGFLAWWRAGSGSQHRFHPLDNP